MPVNCANPTNDQERALCNCNEATQAMVQALENYEKRYLAYTADKTSWNRWNQYWNDWKNKTGDFEVWRGRLSSKEKTFNKKLGWYNNCKSKSDTNETNNQCIAEARNMKLYRHKGFYAYETFRTRGGGPCHWFDVRCKRKKDSIKEIDNDYQAAEPRSDPKDANVRWLGVKEPAPPEQPSIHGIQCCSIIFSDISISGGGVDIDNVNQNCTQKITQELNKNVQPTPTSAETPLPSLPQTPIDSTKQSPAEHLPADETPVEYREDAQDTYASLSIWNTKNVAISIASVVLCLCLCCILISIMVSRS